MMGRMDRESSTTRALIASPPHLRWRGARTRLARCFHVAHVPPRGRGRLGDSKDSSRAWFFILLVGIAEAKGQLAELRRETCQLLSGLLRVLGAARRVLRDLRDLHDAGADLVASARRLAQVPADLARGAQLLLDRRGDRVRDVLDLL